MMRQSEIREGEKGPKKKILAAFVWNEPDHLVGLEQYAEEAGWDIVVVGCMDEGAVERVKSEEWDGAISQIHPNAPEFSDAVAGLNIPKVELTGSIDGTYDVKVLPDATESGRVAAQHFLERGLERFALIGGAKGQFIRTLLEGYAGELDADRLEIIDWDAPEVMAAGYAFMFRGDTRAPGDSISAEVQRYLRAETARLPKPVGVLVPNAVYAYDLAEVCRAVGWRVPKDVSIVTVSDNDRLCLSCRPPLTTVLLDYYAQAWEAAKILDRLMAGEKMASDTVLVPFRMLVVRGSSDLRI